MATRSEQFHAEEQRKGGGTKKKKPSELKKAPRAKKHAGKKATFALEAGKSRKSTRKSANRSKPESSLEIREQAQRNRPSARRERAG